MATSREQVFAGAQLVVGGGRVLPSPSQFYFTGEDRLRLLSANALVGARLKMQARSVGPDGTTQAHSFDHVPNADRSVKVTEHEIGKGSLLNVTVFAGAGAPVIGQTYVMVQIIRGSGAAAVILGTILGGYVTAAQALGFPGSPITNSLDGGGYYRQVQGTVPALGVDWSETVPAGARWQLAMLDVNLFTDATIVNRWPIVRLPMSASTYLMIVPPAPVPANTVLFYDLAAALVAQNQTTAAGVLRFNAALPAEGRLLAGQTFNVVTLGLTATDSWSLPVYLVREWLDP